MTDDSRTRLEFSPPFLGEEEIAEVAEALRSGWISRGPRTRQFEAAFAEYLGAPSALGLSSCTAGLTSLSSYSRSGRVTKSSCRP